MSVNIQVPVEELRKLKLFVAVPMYGGMSAGIFTRSIADLGAICAHYGIPLQFYFLFNESLITRARNYCCDVFMRSDATHLMFIDADIGFNPHDVIALLAMTAQEGNTYDVMGGPYPKKCISWEKIVKAVNKGMADQDPNVLEKYVGDYVFNPKNNTGSIPLNQPVEVLEIGTGFMMIRKATLVRFAEKFPQYMYRPDHVRTADFDGTRKIMQFFQAEIDPVSERYLSEDYWFCQKVQEAGMSVWFCPWMQLSHLGSYIFGGSLADIASIGASATANADEIKAARARAGLASPAAPAKTTSKKSKRR